MGHGGPRSSTPSATEGQEDHSTVAWTRRFVTIGALAPFELETPPGFRSPTHDELAAHADVSLAIKRSARSAAPAGPTPPRAWLDRLRERVLVASAPLDRQRGGV